MSWRCHEDIMKEISWRLSWRLSWRYLMDSWDKEYQKISWRYDAGMEYIYICIQYDKTQLDIMDDGSSLWWNNLDLPDKGSKMSFHIVPTRNSQNQIHESSPIHPNSIVFVWHIPHEGLWNWVHNMFHILPVGAHNRPTINIFFCTVVAQPN